MDVPAQPTPETPPPTPNNPPGPQYEFTKEQNEVMIELEWKMGLLGNFVIIASIAVLIVLVKDLIKEVFPFEVWYGIGGIGAALLALVHGVWLVRASSGFEQIHKTQGRDIDHLMDALKNLNRLFTLAAVAAGILFLWALIRGVISLFS